MESHKVEYILLAVLILALSILACYLSTHTQSIINWFKQQGNWTYYQQIIFC